MNGKRISIRILLGIFLGTLFFAPFAAAEAPLTLEKAITLSLENNENALMGAERVGQAENARIRARAELLPVLSVNGTYTHSDREISFNNRVIQKQNAFTGGASLVLSLFRGPSIPAVKQAKVSVEAARSMATWDKNLIAFQTAEAYFSVLASENLVAAAQRNRVAALELLEAVKARRAAGEALGVDQTRAELQVVSADEALLRAQNGKNGAVDYLAFLINRPPPLMLSPVIVHPMPSHALEKRAVDHRADLKSATKDVEAAKLGRTAAWMDFLPSLSASGNYRLSQNTGWSGDVDSWNIVVTLDWILYDGGLRRAKKRDNSSSHRVAQLKKHLLERQIGLEVRQALRGVSTAEAILKTAEEKLRLARISQDGVRTRYQSGLATSLEVVEADTDLKQAEIGVVVESLNLSLARLALLKSVGLDPLGKEVRP